ncbi:hypothetical protein NGA35_14495 [Pseudomonas stutzeri]|nr:hypothetical protein [Stutzerimonas stutzeri]
MGLTSKKGCEPGYDRPLRANAEPHDENPANGNVGALQGGRGALERLGYRVEARARLASLEDGRAQFL